VPVILYNVPGRTSSNIVSATTVRIARECPNVVGIKEASGDLTQSSEIIRDRPDGFLVLSGDDPTAPGLIYTGGDGVISVIANAFPREWSQMIRLALNRDNDRANAIHNQFLALHRHLYSEGNPAGIKTAMQVLRLCNNEVRLPLTPMSEEGSKAMKRQIEKLVSSLSRAPETL
jgi:4-hydroxy-tetrahydrodipicolinate synthase